MSRLAIFDVDEGMGAKAVAHLKALDVNQEWTILFKKTDVTDEAAVNNTVEETASAFGGIGILLCFAGITECKLAVEYPIDSWRRIFDVNIHGSFLVARAVARSLPPPHLLVYIIRTRLNNHKNRDTIARSGSSSIVFTASMSGYIVNQPQPHSAYAVSKAGVHHLARSMAGEWVGHNIRVNSISPGIMNTRLISGPSQAELRRLWLEKSPLGFGDPEDLTGAVVLLCSEAGRYITGTDIKIDGEFRQYISEDMGALTGVRGLYNVLTTSTVRLRLAIARKDVFHP